MLDFTTAWAGPFTTRSVAFLGAQVIKIEPPAKLDSWRGAVRGGVPERFPDSDPGERPYNRSTLFNTQAHDKLSLALDVTRPGGREVVLGLAREADLVVANFSSGVLDRLGVGYAALSAVNPRISVIEMPAFGAGGPSAKHVGMGLTMEAATGMTGLMGYGDGRPAVTGGTYLDPIGGLHGAAAALIALYQRDASGRGAKIEVAQTEAAAHWIGEFFLERLNAGSAWAPHGNRVPDAAPHDAYQCAGDDEWVAVAVRDDSEWKRLAAVIGRDDLASDPRYASAPAGGSTRTSCGRPSRAGPAGGPRRRRRPSCRRPASRRPRSTTGGTSPAIPACAPRASWCHSSIPRPGGTSIRGWRSGSTAPRAASGRPRPASGSTTVSY